MVYGEYSEFYIYLRYFYLSTFTIGLLNTPRAYALAHTINTEQEKKLKNLTAKCSMHRCFRVLYVVNPYPWNEKLTRIQIVRRRHRQLYCALEDDDFANGKIKKRVHKNERKENFHIQRHGMQRCEMRTQFVFAVNICD